MSAANISAFLLTFVLLISCGKSALDRTDTGNKISAAENDTCEGPDTDINCCFVGMPSELTNVMKIANENEEGNRMIITGRVLKKDGVTPVAGALMYAYHTDNRGYYSKKGNEKGIQKWHGHLYGWCKTDENGRYEIHSIRPARYPQNLFPAHIHSALKETNDTQPFYINDFVFKDDSLVNEKYITSQNEEGGSGVVDLVKSADGILRGERNIVVD